MRLAPLAALGTGRALGKDCARRDQWCNCCNRRSQRLSAAARSQQSAGPCRILQHFASTFAAILQHFSAERRKECARSKAPSSGQSQGTKTQTHRRTDTSKFGPKSGLFERLLSSPVTQSHSLATVSPQSRWPQSQLPVTVAFTLPFLSISVPCRICIRARPQLCICI